MNSIFETTKRNLQIIKEKSNVRKLLLAKSLGLPEADDSINSILAQDEKNNRKLIRKVKRIKKNQNLKLIAENNNLRANEILSNLRVNNCDGEFEDDLAKEEDYEGPKNDYNQYFVDIGQRPQNFIRDPGLNERFEEYPKLRELIRLKDELISKTNIPAKPMYLKSNLVTKNGSDFPLHDQIGCEFDVILLEPPLYEYQNANGVHFDKYFTWDEIKAIDVGSVAAQRSFIFLWCGSADGLDKGRECLKKWGFRRCEDICWIQTNKSSPHHNRNIDNGAIFQRSKEHCLMGIKGTVRRSLDSHFIHTNIDIDLIITEEPGYGRPDKPEEIFHIIEHFCLGKRRLYLFGRDNTIRPGWLTIGPDISESYFDKDVLSKLFEQDPNGNFTGSSERIDMLRPKTPPLKAKQQQLALNSALSAISNTSQISSNVNNSINSLNNTIIIPNLQDIGNTNNIHVVNSFNQDATQQIYNSTNNMNNMNNFSNPSMMNQEIQNNQFGF